MRPETSASFLPLPDQTQNNKLEAFSPNFISILRHASHICSYPITLSNNRANIAVSWVTHGSFPEDNGPRLGQQSDHAIAYPVHVTTALSQAFAAWWKYRVFRVAAHLWGIIKYKRIIKRKTGQKENGQEKHGLAIYTRRCASFVLLPLLPHATKSWLLYPRNQTLPTTAPSPE